MSDQNPPSWAAHGYGFSLVFGGRYAIFTDGRVVRNACELRGRSNCVRKCPEKTLRQFNCNRGYLCVTIADPITGVTKCRSVHTIACEAFHGHSPDENEVNHKNGIKKDNMALNLEWVTRSENQSHAVRTGLRPSGIDCHTAFLSESDVHKIRELARGRVMPQTEIADIFGICQTQVSRIKLGKQWKKLS